MKKITAVILSLMLLLTACTGVSQDEHDKLQQELDELREMINQQTQPAEPNLLRLEKVGKWVGRTIGITIFLELNLDESFVMTQEFNNEVSYLTGTYDISETQIILSFTDDELGLEVSSTLDYEDDDENMLINFGGNKKISFERNN